jgi:hypothetical protein
MAGLSVSVRLKRMPIRVADLLGTAKSCIANVIVYSAFRIHSGSQLFGLARSLRPHSEFTAGSRRALDSRSSDQQSYMICQVPILEGTSALPRAVEQTAVPCSCGSLPLILSPRRGLP